MSNAANSKSRGPKPHLTKQWKNHRMPAKKDSEFYCRFCSARITDSENMGELGHAGGCPKRPEHFPGWSITYEDKETECPTCGREDFLSVGSMRIHHAHKHGESLIGPKECANCDTVFMPTRNRVNCCSVECANQNKRLAKVECNQCEELFRPAYSGKQFCSRECRHESMKRRVELECETCAETFEVKPNKSHRRFCSKACEAFRMWYMPYSGVVRCR